MKKLLIFAALFASGLIAQNPVLRDVSCTDAGSTDAYACSAAVAPSGYVTGSVLYRFMANTANTGAATFNLNSLGAKTIKKAAGGVTTDLSDNDIRAGQWVDLVYDGTNMQMQSSLGNAAAGGGGGASLATGSGYVWVLGDPQSSTNASLSTCAAATCFFEFVLNVSIPSGTLTAQFAHNMASTEWVAFGLYDSACNLISGTTGRVQGGGAATFATLSLSPAALSPGVYFVGLASTSSGGIYSENGVSFDYLNQGATKRFFNGNAPTGSTSTLAVPSACGTRTSFSSSSLKPIIALIK